MNNIWTRFLILSVSFFFNFSIFAQSPFIGLVLEEIPNSGFTNGEKTYRLYAQLSSGSVFMMFGDETRPHSIVTTTTFFNQDLFGNHSNLQSQVNTGAFGFLPALQYDTWAALGDSYTSAPSTLGNVGFGSNLSDSSWTFGGSVNSDASIYRLSTDSLTLPDANGRVLLGQFTTTGVLSGFINLQGSSGGVGWTAANIPIPQLPVPGCTDPLAFNYNASANTDDGSCVAVVNGCTDPTALNYNPSANTNDGSCVTVVNGCTDPTACNYNASANTDDGSCDLPNGCGDPLYVEYSASVTCSDANACLTLIVNGCTDPTAFNYNASANTDDGSCISVVSGCTDPLACNYNASANTDDGSCIYQGQAPTLACYETATFNTTTCVWDVTGTQDPQPTIACYETATFNTTSCSWVISGTQDPQPTVACYETATFNTTTCVWDVTGTQDPQPTVACYETATFNTTTCVWDVTGTQDPQPTGLACWQTATFNTTTCLWDVTGTQPTSTTDVTECNYYVWNGYTYISSGSYQVTIINSQGCDSIAWLNLTINSGTTSSTTAISCDTYTWAAPLGDGNIYTASGTYTHVSTNAAGCENTETLNLIINSSTSNSTTATACDTYTWAAPLGDGNTYTTSGVYTHVSTNASGCDHIEIFNLTINPSPNLPIITQLFSTSLTTGVFDSYQWYRDGILLNGETSQTLNLLQAGVYTVVVFNLNGCSTESNPFPFGVTAIDEVLVKEFRVFPNPTADVLHIRTPQSLGKDYNVAVYDFIGKKVLEFDNIKLQLEQPLIDLRGLALSNYKLMIIYKNGDIWNTTINKQ